ncbi:MAG: aminomethyl-transferring glycine dehydrogenase subunit GcvPB [Thermotogota bacterium]
MSRNNKLIFEKGVPGRIGYSFPKENIPNYRLEEMIPKAQIRENPPELPDCNEVEVVRHFTNLSKLNHSIDNGFYPLGSCTMKYNPKLNETTAMISGFVNLHPYQPPETFQGALELMYFLQQALAEISGMDEVTLQPAAGAHGELTGMLLIRAYHDDRGDTNRKTVIVPDSAHGTNPATAAMCGYNVKEVESDEKGRVNLAMLKDILNETVAAIMLTNPNTLGLFEDDILEIQKLAHENGTLLYYDGANMNAIMGKIRPGDMGFDVLHYNLHKTFSTPHGMGGPGSGAVGVKGKLAPYLPVPLIKKEEERYSLDFNIPKSIGRIKGYYGNFNVLIRAATYILTMGADGIKAASEMSVLNANYLRNKIAERFKIPFGKQCMHEFVADGSSLKKHGLKTLDFAKALLDYGVHPPTIYFPLIVHEALMIEPTETESKETLDHFVDIVDKILEQAQNEPEKLKNAPYTTPVRRLDELKANKDLEVKYQK